MTHKLNTIAADALADAIADLPVRELAEDAAFAGATLQAICFGSSYAAGWWTDLTTGEPTTTNPLCFSNKLALIHSEVSEAMEGDRKNLMDDKLPHRKMAEVELADAAIRIFDLAGAYEFNLGAAIAEKLAYNRERADHKPENRILATGKSY